MPKATVEITTENQWSDFFYLYGDGTGWQRRCLVGCSVLDHGSTVVLNRYNADRSAVVAAVEVTSSMEAVETPVPGDYKVGVPTGGYGSTPFTITVEQ